ncbi:HDIG domain-containing protein [candidate division WOR-3 bacterium]|nr:HDIG domain-containing protein [candidate division WOR-3 bacterium]
MERISKTHIILLFLLLIIFNIMYPYERKIILLRKGDIASRDFIAPYTFNILKTEEELEEERKIVSIRVPPVLKFIEIPDRERIVESLDSLINDIATQSQEKWRILRRKKSVINLFLDILGNGVISDRTGLPEFINNNFLVVKEDTNLLVPIAKIRDSKEARKYFSEEVKGILGESDETQSIVNSIQPFINPNLLIDFSEIEKRQEEARKMIKDSIGVVRKGEKIVGAHEVVTGDAYRKIYSLSQRQAGEYPYSIISTVLRNQLYFLLICLFILVFLFVREKKIYRNSRFLYLFVINMFLILLLHRFVPIYLLPLASIVMFLTLAVDLDFGILFALSSSLVIFLYQGFTVEKIIPILTGSLVGGIFLIDPRNRTDWYRTGAIIAVTTSLLILSIEFFIRSTLKDVIIGFSYGITNGFLSILLLFALLFIFERAFNITTNFTWMEYADLNNPLLKRLSREASGTYQHSLMVSTMAENAAEAIGANTLLSKVGGLYHDIGKLMRPDFFAENFREGKNPHNDIPPKLSAIIIKSHIPDGVKIAKEYKLPVEIIDVIKQHQGTYLIVPFYEKAKKYLDDVNEEDFKYDAELPVSRESGILMLADIVGATVRSMDNPTEKEIKEMIEKQINKQFTRGQLSRSELSIKNLNIISNQFAQTLEGLYHYRPTYPETE